MEAVSGLFAKCFANCFGEKEEEPTPVLVCMDQHRKGEDVRISNGGIRATGTGTVLANGTIEQDCVYFELEIIESGTVCVGVAREGCDLNKPLGFDDSGWGLRSDGKLIHGDQLVDGSDTAFASGDVLGCGFDQRATKTVTFYRNGEEIKSNFSGLRGEFYPAFGVADGAVIDVNFGTFGFAHDPPQGFAQMFSAVSVI